MTFSGKTSIYYEPQPTASASSNSNFHRFKLSPVTYRSHECDPSKPGGSLLSSLATGNLTNLRSFYRSIVLESSRPTTYDLS
jgi:hypothetical protein